MLGSGIGGGIHPAAELHSNRLTHALTASAKAVAALLLAIIALFAAVGWVYVLRGLGWFSLGPRLHDALPLLQLAGFDAQPLARIAVAFVSTGALAGAALLAVPRPWRAAMLGALALLVLLVVSQASFALTRNLRFSAVVWSRSPSGGPWLEALLFALGAALPARRRS